MRHLFQLRTLLLATCLTACQMTTGPQGEPNPKPSASTPVQPSAPVPTALPNRFISLEQPNPEFDFQVLAPHVQVEWIAGASDYGFEDGPALGAKFKQIADITPLNATEILLADLFNHRICKLDQQGQVTTVVGNGQDEVAVGPLQGETALSHPRKIVMNSEEILIQDGNAFIYSLLDQNFRVWRANEGRINSLKEKGEINDVNMNYLRAREAYDYSCFVEHQGILYLCHSNQVFTINQNDGSLQHFLGHVAPTQSPPPEDRYLDSTAQNSRFFRPYDLLFMPSGEIYIADIGNHRVRKYNPQADQVSTVVGQAFARGLVLLLGGFKDGPVDQAWLNGIARLFLLRLEPEPVLVIADNASLRLLTSSHLYTLARDLVPLAQVPDQPNRFWAINGNGNQVFQVTLDTDALLDYLERETPIFVSEKFSRRQ